MSSALAPLRSQLHGLRTELAELAFALERQGRLDAADVAMALHGRLGELGETDAATGHAADVADVYLPNKPLTALNAPSAWAGSIP